MKATFKMKCKVHPQATLARERSFFWGLNDGKLEIDFECEHKRHVRQH
jgi:hypothetical protein